MPAGLTIEQQTLIEARVANDKPFTGVTYLLWFFLGWLSAHRFYLGRPISALLQIASFLILIGFVWLFIDLFLMPGMARAKSAKRRRELTDQLLRGGAIV